MHNSVRITALLVALLLMVATLVIVLIYHPWSNSTSNPLTGLIQPAAPLVEPVTKDISADRGWQNTGILLTSGETIRFQFMSGEINDGNAVIRGLNGVGWVCGQSDCCEPMPNVARDALIGRVSDHLFPIGDRSEITVSANGELQLRINDCDAGLFDNAGSFQVKISP